MRVASKRPSAVFGRLVVHVVFWGVLVLNVSGLLARHVGPNPLWMLQLVAIFLPYLAIAAALSSLLLIVVKKRAAIILQIGLLIWLAIRFVPTTRNVGHEEAHPLSLITYNSPYPQNRVSPENEAEFQFLIEEYEPNVVGFQETFLGYLERDITRVVGRGDVTNVFSVKGYEIARPRPIASIAYYQPVLTNFRVDETQQIIFDDNPFPIETELTRIRFLWDGKPVVLYNLHLASYGASKPWHEENVSYVSSSFWMKYLRQYRRAIQARAWEAKKIRELIDNETDPIIVLGDFNATRHNWSYNRVRGDMIDVFRASGSGRSKTYHRRYPFARIDHILVSGDFIPLTSRVLNTTRSDHKALWGLVALAPEAD